MVTWPALAVSFDCWNARFPLGSAETLTVELPPEDAPPPDDAVPPPVVELAVVLAVVLELLLEPHAASASAAAVANPAARVIFFIWFLPFLGVEAVLPNQFGPGSKAHSPVNSGVSPAKKAGTARARSAVPMESAMPWRSSWR